ncbi:MAG: ferritin [Solirubrobacterales bacterium]
MLKPALQDALNAQVKNEFYSANVYLAMVAWFEDQGLSGFATWMRAQYQEELEHGIKIFDFIVDRDGSVVIEAIDAPPLKWDSPLAAFEAAYENEKAVSMMIDDLYDLAAKENDHATQVMLQWFITEQVEEEASTKAAVDKLRLAGTDGGALFVLDQQFGSRQASQEG